MIKMVDFLFQLIVETKSGKLIERSQRVCLRMALQAVEATDEKM